MDIEIKSEIEEGQSFSLKLENDEIPEMESSELPTEEEYHFATENELAIPQYQEDNDNDVKGDIIDKFVIEGAQQVFEAAGANTFVTESLDDGGHAEQFLTIPRGSTQIAVCDNGNIVYTDEGLLNITESAASSSNDITTVNSGETLYYHPQSDDVPTEEMQVESLDESGQYIHQVVDVSGLAGVESDHQQLSAEDLGQDVTSEHVEGLESVLNRTDLRKVITIQPLHDAARGVKRSLPSPSNKNIITKVFVQGNSNNISQGQPFKIIGGMSGSVVGGRTMSLVQAQKLGLISSPTKIQQVVQGSSMTSPNRMIVKKVIPPSGGSVLAIKSPTKILPAPPPNKTRIPSLGVRGTVSQGNLLPVRTNIPVSHLKTLTAISTSTTQVKPLTVSKMTTVVGKPPQKVYFKPGSTVLSPIPGPIARLPQNATFQPIQIGGKQPVQYLKLVGTGGNVSGMKPKFVKAIAGRSIPIAPSPVFPKAAGSSTIVGKKILLPVSGDGDKIPLGAIHVKSPVVPISVKGKTITTIRPGLQITQNIDNDDIMVLPVDDLRDKSDNQEDMEELCDKENVGLEDGRSESPSRLLEANGIRPKKPCNCTRSQCLKLYCECFANGEFCFQCNCNNCYNNIEHEEERQLSIRSCLDRNPSAFRPKIQIGDSEEEDRRHNKGCNCKRSGCFKNYCECFEAKIPCSKSCKCQGCKNTEEELKAFKEKETSEEEVEEEGAGKSHKFMSPSLAEALCQCILAQAEVAERNGDDVETTERRIIEEFGQCLVQIIGNRNKRDSR